MENGLNTLEIITAISTAASAIFAAWVLWETKKYRRPYIVIRLVKSEEPFYALEIKNIGGGTAYDISIRFDRRVFSKPDYLTYFNNIPFLEPGGVILYGLQQLDLVDLIQMNNTRAKCTWFATPTQIIRFPFRKSVLSLNPNTLSQNLVINSEKESNSYDYKRTLRGWVTRTRK